MTVDLGTPLARARTLLFVPGNRPERFDKAIASGADAIVLDLEDSVPIAAKQVARNAIAGAWRGLLDRRVTLVVRINALSGIEDAEGRQDLEWLAGLAPGSGVMLSKADGASGLAALHACVPNVPLLPLIESAAGYVNLAAIASAPGVLRLVVGQLDFMADTGMQCSADEQELAPLRFAVAMQTRLQSLAAPVDGVTTALNDENQLRADTQRAVRHGFGAKLCIHPKQIETVHAALAPDSAALDWARRVLNIDAVAAGAAVQLDGCMVDTPVVLQARRILARNRG